MEKLPQIIEVKHRLPSFDILRIILVILVINIHREHFTGAVALFPNRFGWYAVPAFVILSFYLTSSFYSGYPPAFNSVIKRVKRFFLPFLFWSALGFVVSPDAFNIRNIFMQIATGGVINVPLYYLLLMSAFTMFFWLLTFMPLKHRVVTMIILTLAMFYLQYSGLNYSFFSSVEPAIMYCWGRIAELLPFAVTGILIGMFTARKMSIRNELLLTGLVGGLYFAAQTTNQPNGINYGGTLLYFGSVFIFMYFLLVRNFRLPEQIENVISKLGAYSFGAYVSHYLVFEVLFKYVPGSKEFNNNFPLLFLLLFTAVCYTLVIGLNKLSRGRFSYFFK